MGPSDLSAAPMSTPMQPQFAAPLPPLFSAYQLDAAYDEMFAPDCSPRPEYLRLCQQAADLSFLHQTTATCRPREASSRGA